MTAEEKLTLIDWCRNSSALNYLTRQNRPLKMLGNRDGTALKAIWRPVSIAQRDYSLCAEIRPDGALELVTFRNLRTDASLEMTSQRSASRLSTLSEVAKSLTA